MVVRDYMSGSLQHPLLLTLIFFVSSKQQNRETLNGLANLIDKKCSYLLKFFFLLFVSLIWFIKGVIGWSFPLYMVSHTPILGVTYAPCDELLTLLLFDKLFYSNLLKTKKIYVNFLKVVQNLSYGRKIFFCIFCCC